MRYLQYSMCLESNIFYPFFHFFTISLLLLSLCLSLSFLYQITHCQTCIQRPPLGAPKQQLLLSGGRCSEIIYVIKVPNGTTKWWSLQIVGRYSEVVVSSGLTVYSYIHTSYTQHTSTQFFYPCQKSQEKYRVHFVFGKV